MAHYLIFTKLQTIRITNNMKRLLSIIAAIEFSTATLSAQEATLNNTQEYVEVSVRINKDVVPDEIFLNITISERDNKGKISVQQQENQMIKALVAAGIDIKENLTVNDIASSLNSRILKKDNALVTKDYTLMVSSAATAAKVIEALNTIGITRVGIGKVSISDNLEREIKNQLLTEAAQMAQENAKILAQAVGSTIGKAIYIQNYYTFDSAANGRIMMKSYAMDMARESTTEDSVELEISKQSLSINVTCKFRLF